MKTAFLFPGQASQKVGMGLDLYHETELGKKYFNLANEIMRMDLKEIIFNGPEETLRQTQFTQPAIYVVSTVLGKLLLQKNIIPIAVAGHSLGEYSALTISGAFSFETGLRLVKLRAESMQEVGEITNGTMAAIIGLDKDSIIEICDQINKDGIVVPANFNAPGQIVISGEIEAVNQAMNQAKEAGARKVIELNVSGAFHSPLMSNAKKTLTDELNSIEIVDTNFPIYSNVTAKPVTKSDDIRKSLIQQLDNAVLWQDTIINMIQDGIVNFLEVGPGRVLQGLTKRIDRNVISSGIETNIDVNSYTND
ncbi:MAG: ACP S-malonyltransferase [Planctomycetia bacterium]|nr:ACP S-malonyltransferase [Planctomycetia bacterium]